MHESSHLRSHTALLIIIASIWIVCAVGVHYSNAITVKTNSQAMRGYFNEPHSFVIASEEKYNKYFKFTFIFIIIK